MVYAFSLWFRLGHNKDPFILQRLETLQKKGSGWDKEIANLKSESGSKHEGIITAAGSGQIIYHIRQSLAGVGPSVFIS